MLYKKLKLAFNVHIRSTEMESPTKEFEKWFEEWKVVVDQIVKNGYEDWLAEVYKSYTQLLQTLVTCMTEDDKKLPESEKDNIRKKWKKYHRDLCDVFYKIDYEKYPLHTKAVYSTITMMEEMIYRWW